VALSSYSFSPQAFGMAGRSTLKCLAASTNRVPVSSSSDTHVSRFERELEALRKELAEATARSGRSSPTNEGNNLSRGPSNEYLTMTRSPVIIENGLPSVEVEISDDIGMPAAVLRKKEE
jgi:hypothetical protein